MKRKLVCIVLTIAIMCSLLSNKKSSDVALESTANTVKTAFDSTVSDWEVSYIRNKI